MATEKQEKKNHEMLLCDPLAFVYSLSTDFQHKKSCDCFNENTVLKACPMLSHFSCDGNNVLI